MEEETRTSVGFGSMRGVTNLLKKQESCREGMVRVRVVVVVDQEEVS